MKYTVTAEFENLTPQSTITVYHGTDALGMKEMLRFGLDATKVHHRSYNQGRERGLYITPDLKTARQFGNWILEFDVKAKDLYPTARWGLGSQRKNDLSGLTDKYKNSFRPLVSYQLNERIEPQAMFIGYVPLTKVKSIHKYSYSGSQDLEEVTVKEAEKMLETSLRDWSPDMSADDMITLLSEKNEAMKSDIIEAFNAYDDYDAIIRDFGIPRKLGLRLKQYLIKIKAKKPMANAGLQALSRQLTVAGINHVIVA